MEANLRKALQCCCNGCYQQLPVGCVSSQSIISPGMSSCTFFHEKPFKKLWNEIKIGRAARTFSFAWNLTRPIYQRPRIFDESREQIFWVKEISLCLRFSYYNLKDEKQFCRKFCLKQPLQNLCVNFVSKKMLVEKLKSFKFDPHHSVSTDESFPSLFFCLGNSVS